MDLEQDIMPGPAATLVRLWRKTGKDSRWLVSTVTIFKDLRTLFNFHGDCDEQTVETVLSMVRKLRKNMPIKKPAVKNQVKMPQPSGKFRKGLKNPKKR